MDGCVTAMASGSSTEPLPLAVPGSRVAGGEGTPLATGEAQRHGVNVVKDTLLHSTSQHGTTRYNTAQHRNHFLYAFVLEILGGMLRRSCHAAGKEAEGIFCGWRRPT